MPTKQLRNVTHRWPAKIVDKLHVVAQEHVMSANAYVLSLVRNHVETEYNRIQQEATKADTNR